MTAAPTERSGNMLVAVVGIVAAFADGDPRSLAADGFPAK
jgi:hypothetical protein